MKETSRHTETKKSVFDKRETLALIVEGDRSSPTLCILERITASCLVSS